jgi:hypothetical protein
MEGNFSALVIKRIREKSKNDPPYWTWTVPNQKTTVIVAESKSGEKTWKLVQILLGNDWKNASLPHTHKMSVF